MKNSIFIQSEINAKKIEIKEAGFNVFSYTFQIENIPDELFIKSKAYPFHAVYVNNEFAYSDEFSTTNLFNISSFLRAGENTIDLLLFTQIMGGWVQLESLNPSFNISTSNSDFTLNPNSELLGHEIRVCVRGDINNPYDGNGSTLNAMPYTPQYPKFVFKAPFDDITNTLFPDTNKAIKYNKGDKVPIMGEIVIDFGEETVGYIQCEITSDSDNSITFSYAESFNMLDANLWFHDRDTFNIKKGTNKITNPSRKGYRYVKITQQKPAVTQITSFVNLKTQALFPNKGYFRCSDDFLNKLNDVSVKTIEICSQKFLEDGVKRDRLCWTGDLRPMAQVIYNQLGNTDIVKTSLYIFANHLNDEGIIQPAFPWKTGWVMTDYVMWWIISLWEYYNFTMDYQTMLDLGPVAIEQANWLASKCDERGLIITKPEKDAPITCWSSRNRDGYTSYHNTLYYHTLNCLSFIKDILQIDDDRDWKAEEKQHIILRESLTDEDTIFRDIDFEGKHRNEVPYDGNINAIMFGLSISDSFKKHQNNTHYILERIERKGWTEYGTPIWWPQSNNIQSTESNRIMPLYNAYEAECRIKNGEFDSAYEILKRCFGSMLDKGATTFWEAMTLNGMPYDGENAGFGSLCHGWSGYPAAILPTLLGCSVDVWNDEVFMNPMDVCRKFEYIEAEIPSRFGNVQIKSEFDKNTGLWKVSGFVPEDAPEATFSTTLLKMGYELVDTINCEPAEYEDEEEESDSEDIFDITSGEDFQIIIQCESY
ncbi:MAG: family 78 glycoside hydrolase catalytic domain [Armatimonadota bacterium]